MCCYQHPKLYSANEDVHPVFLGPIFLHKEVDQIAYSDFFHHIKSRIGKVAGIHTQGHNLILGSDDERAIISAFKDVFSDGDNIICFWHIKNNLERNLTKFNVPKEQRKEIIQSILGNSTDKESGIIHSQSQQDFAAQLEGILQQDFVKENIELEFYLSQLLDKLQVDVWQATQKYEFLKFRYYNNACESINRTFKNLTHQIPHGVPQVIKIIDKFYQMQARDVYRALYGQGRYRLIPKLKKIEVDLATWQRLSNKARIKKLRTIYGTGNRPSDRLSSKCGRVSIKKPSLASKPGDR